MNRMVLATALFTLMLGQTDRTASAKRECSEFEELAIVLEQNATDGDAEVVLFAKAGDEGLKRLRIIAPDERIVANVQGDDRGVGLREFSLESAEPPDFDAILRSFPEGTYRISGRTVSGQCIAGTTDLSHEFAPETILRSPMQDEDIPLGPLTLAWDAVPEAVRYIVELENESEGSEAQFTFEILAPTTSLEIPAALIAAGDHLFGVFVVTESGNKTSVEVTFSISET